MAGNGGPSIDGPPLPGVRRLPGVGRGFLQVWAKAMHWGLYALLAAIVIAGIALVWVRGDIIFNFSLVPSFAPGNKALRHDVQEIHGAMATLILVLAGLHAAAGLFHHYVRREPILTRMMPERR